jgi:hypothetical protein
MQNVCGHFLNSKSLQEQVIAADVFALGLILWFMCTGALES